MPAMTTETDSSALGRLYPDHVREIQSRHERALERAGASHAVIFAGAPRQVFLDDYSYPFKANPHFLSWVPLLAMYPEADVPVLQVSMPDLDPEHLFEVGRRLAPLRDEGVLIVGSGFMTHGLPYIGEFWDGRPGAPTWSREFDLWAAEALQRGDVDTLFAFREKAPGMPFAHPTVEHFAPLFVTLGASVKPDDAPKTAIDGFFIGLSKRSIETR